MDLEPNTRVLVPTVWNYSVPVASLNPIRSPIVLLDLYRIIYFYSCAPVQDLYCDDVFIPILATDLTYGTWFFAIS